MRMLNYTPDTSPFHRRMTSIERAETRNSSPTRRTQASSRRHNFSPSPHSQAWVKRRLKRDNRYATNEVDLRSPLSHPCKSKSYSKILSQPRSLGELHSPWPQPVQRIAEVEQIQEKLHEKGCIEHREQSETRELPEPNYASITDMDFMDSNTLTDVSDLTNYEDLDGLHPGNVSQLRNSFFLNQTTGGLDSFQLAMSKNSIDNSKRKVEISRSEMVTVGRFSGMSLEATMFRRKSISDRKQGTSNSLRIGVLTDSSESETKRIQDKPGVTRNGHQRSYAIEHSNGHFAEGKSTKDEILSPSSNTTSYHERMHNLDSEVANDKDNIDIEESDTVNKKKQKESICSSPLSSKYTYPQPNYPPDYLLRRKKWTPRLVHKNIHKFIETFDRNSPEQLSSGLDFAVSKQCSSLSTNYSMDENRKQLRPSISTEGSVSLGENRMSNVKKSISSFKSSHISERVRIYSNSSDSVMTIPKVQTIDSEKEKVEDKNEDLDNAPMRSTHKAIQRYYCVDANSNTSESDIKGSSPAVFQKNEFIEDSHSIGRSGLTSNSESRLGCMIKVKGRDTNHIMKDFIEEDVEVDKVKPNQEYHGDNMKLYNNKAGSHTSDDETMKRSIHEEHISSVPPFKVAKAPTEKESVKLIENSHSTSKPKVCQDGGKKQTQKKKDDPTIGYDKYLKMMKMGLPTGAVNHAILRDGLDPKKVLNVIKGKVELDDSSNIGMKKTIEDNTSEIPRDMYRRTRLYWTEITNFSETSLWFKLESDKDISEYFVS